MDVDIQVIYYEERMVIKQVQSIGNLDIYRNLDMVFLVDLGKVNIEPSSILYVYISNLVDFRKVLPPYIYDDTNYHL